MLLLNQLHFIAPYPTQTLLSPFHTFCFQDGTLNSTCFSAVFETLSNTWKKSKHKSNLNVLTFNFQFLHPLNPLNHGTQRKERTWPDKKNTSTIPW
jgi:hypothetical protein